MGTGSFALEAAEAAGRGNAQSITLVSRPRHRCAAPAGQGVGRAGGAAGGPPSGLEEQPTCNWAPCRPNLLDAAALPSPCSWVLPFSRQYTVTAVSFLPLVSWPLKVKLVQWYLRRNFFKPCGLANVPPTGRLDEQDWGGERAGRDGAGRGRLAGAEQACACPLLPQAQRRRAALPAASLPSPLPRRRLQSPAVTPVHLLPPPPPPPRRPVQ